MAFAITSRIIGIEHGETLPAKLRARKNRAYTQKRRRNE